MATTNPSTFSASGYPAFATPQRTRARTARRHRSATTRQPTASARSSDRPHQWHRARERHPAPHLHLAPSQWTARTTTRRTRTPSLPQTFRLLSTQRSRSTFSAPKSPRKSARRPCFSSRQQRLPRTSSRPSTTRTVATICQSMSRRPASSRPSPHSIRRSSSPSPPTSCQARSSSGWCCRRGSRQKDPTLGQVLAQA